MKKISIVISALAVIVCGCSKEQDTRLLISNQDTNVVSFKAFFEGEDPETKLGINTSSGVLNWANGDAIAVQMTDDTFIPFTYSSTTKEFSATLGAKEVKDGGVAYYPASIAINGTPGSVNLPTSYTIGADATVCPPMIATVNLGAKSLSLKHLGGILSVKVSYVPADADKLVLSVPGKTATGTFAVTDAADDYISAGTGNSTVTLNFTKGVFGTTAREFFFPVPVTSFSGGFTVDFKNEANETLYTHSTAKTSIEAARASIKRMAELTVPKYVYVSDNSGDSWVDVKVYGYSTSGDFSSWPGVSLSGDTFTHSSHSYKRIAIPEANLGDSDGEVIVSGLAVGASEGDIRTYIRARQISLSLNHDIYLYLSPTTLTEYKTYIIDQSSGDFDLHIKVWGDTIAPDGAYSGFGLHVNDLYSEGLGNNTVYYIKAASGDTFSWLYNKNAWGAGNQSGDINNLADKNYVYYITAGGDGNWDYPYNYYPCTLSVE